MSKKSNRIYFSLPVLISLLATGALVYFAFYFANRASQPEEVVVSEAATTTVNPNGGFESGNATWVFYTNGSASFSLSSPGSQNSSSAGKVAVSEASSNTQLYQAGLSVTSGATYRITFDAYSSDGDNLSVALLQHGSPYTNYGINQTVDLGTGWKTYTYDFTTKNFSGNVNDARLRFTFNGFSNGSTNYYIDNVTLVAVTNGSTPTPTRGSTTPTTRPTGAVTSAPSPAPSPISGEPPLLSAPSHQTNGGPSFRVICPFGQRKNDDPIVFPGLFGASHEHQFFGNTAADADSTYNELITKGTTCNIAADTAAYWIPSLYDTNGNLKMPGRVRAYYYANTNSSNQASLQAFPRNLRIIAGNNRATSPQPEGAVEWLCRNKSDQAAGYSIIDNTPPTCRSDQYLSLSIRFPDCVARMSNGQPMLDSSDHKRHMAYSDSGKNCPSSHPIKLPKLRISITYDQNGGFSGGNFTLGGRAGAPMSLPAYAMHADFWNTWNQSALESIVKGCLINKDNTGGTTCFL